MLQKPFRGKDFGHYTIKSLLGSGGMGAVYRAWDSRLRRDVAIKVLPDPFSQDMGRISRFRREAEILASLNHPHIASIYGIEQANDGSRFLVLELVDGESLADRLHRGPLAISEALRIAGQIAEALEAAHEQGVVHRDLKPANICITRDGRVKVLDFGLAKVVATDPVHVSSESPTAPTVSLEGAIVGTPAYMSPEQAKGEPSAATTDIWAFGCVLFEMLTGHLAFGRESTTETLARIIEGQPELNLLPADTPPLVGRLLRRCLEKNPRERLRHIGDARADIRDALSVSSAPSPAPSRSLPGPRVRQLTLVGSIALVATAAVWLASWSADSESPAAQVWRLEIAAPQNAETSSNEGIGLALSKDGRLLAYQTVDGPVIRSADRTLPVRLENLTGFSNPFFSPDGEWIAFGTRTMLTKIPTSGGPVRAICDCLVNPSFGGDWHANTIVFATSAGLFQVSADGGTPELLAKADLERGELYLTWPQILPTGDSVLYTIRPQETNQGSQVAMLNLKTRKSRTLFRGGANARYVAPGYLVYVAGQKLEARTFDLDTLETGKDPITLDISVALARPYSNPSYELSLNGTLIYVAAAAGTSSRLVWVDRQGQEEALPPLPRPMRYPRIRPKSKEVALDLSEANRDIWILDLLQPSALRRFTEDPRADGVPLWSHDGRVLFFGSRRAEDYSVYRQSADRTGDAERLIDSRFGLFPGAVTADGMHLITFGDGDLSIVPLREPQNSRKLLQVKFATNPVISPNGRWLAYQSQETGEMEIHVRPFPDVDRKRWTVSVGGGIQPRWAPGGNELSFLTRTSNDMMAVPVQSGQDFEYKEPQKLFPNRCWGIGGALSYDVADDGRFLMVREQEVCEPGKPYAINVVVNWVEEIRKRVPR